MMHNCRPASGSVWSLHVHLIIRAGMLIRLCALWLCGWPLLCTAADDIPADRVGELRREVLERTAREILITSTDPAVPKALEAKPLFRYDDHTRGYVDAFVWRLGATGRPLAIITNELHPNYLGSGKKVVYDLLSLTSIPFTAKSNHLAWSPRSSAVEFVPYPEGPEPAESSAARLQQIKALARRFTATQEVMEIDTVFVHLRLLPKEIERYAPTTAPRSDGAIFLFVNGRNPGMVLLIETDGSKWFYGVGRLSMPSTLKVQLNGKEVWSRPPGGSNDGAYNATNGAAEFP
jgi:hypothetical protein